jgi:uroporphyrin-III C-methyltransferase
LIAHSLVDLAPPEAVRIDVGKKPGQPTRQSDINALLIEHGGQGREVVRLKGGDPFLFGRGGEEVAALAEAGVEVRVLPGVSSATAAPALAGIPLTLRGVSASVAFCTAQIADGPARLHDLARTVDTLVVLMALGRASELAGELAEVLGDDRPAAIVSSASTPRQQVVTATLGTLPAALAANDVAAPAMLVVGEVVAAASFRGEQRPLRVHEQPEEGSGEAGHGHHQQR